jgi:hypothetical protein
MKAASFAFIVLVCFVAACQAQLATFSAASSASQGDLALFTAATQAGGLPFPATYKVPSAFSC